MHTHPSRLLPLLATACCGLSMAASPAPISCQAPAIVPTLAGTKGMDLVQVQVLTRHGDRVPIHALPGSGEGATWSCNMTFNSHPGLRGEQTESAGRMYSAQFLPGRNLLLGDCMSGQLTERGRSQHLALGAALRKRYVQDLGFLPSTLDSEAVWVRSTNVPRTIQSAQSLIDGLFPAQGSSAPAVTAIHTMDEAHEDMTPNAGMCPRLGQLMAAAQSSAGFRAQIAQYNATLSSVFAKFGLSGFDAHDFSSIYDDSTCRHCHEKGLPNGVTLEEVERMRVLGGWAVRYELASQEETRRLSMAPLVQELAQRMTDAVAEEAVKAGEAHGLRGGAGEEEESSAPATPRFLLYSGHDTTVQPLVVALQAQREVTETLPPYATHIEFELWRDSNGSFHVAGSYNGVSLQLPGCGGALCPLQAFLDNAKQAMPLKPYAAACKAA